MNTLTGELHRSQQTHNQSARLYINRLHALLKQSAPLISITDLYIVTNTIVPVDLLLRSWLKVASFAASYTNTDHLINRWLKDEAIRNRRLIISTASTKNVDSIIRNNKVFYHCNEHLQRKL